MKLDEFCNFTLGLKFSYVDYWGKCMVREINSRQLSIIGKMKISLRLISEKVILIVIFLQAVNGQAAQPAKLDFTTEATPAGGNATGGNGTGAPPDPNQIAATEFRAPAAWLRICQPGPGKSVGVVSTSNNDCPSGYWFKDTLKIGCACGHGVWVFAKGWCDHTAKIIVAKNGSCFNVNKDVKLIRHIGWSHSAFLPFHFVSTSGMEFLQAVPDVSTLGERASYFNYEFNQHIGSIHRERAIESLTGRVCLSTEGNISRPLALKYFAQKLPYLQQRTCFGYAHQDESKFEYDAGYEIDDATNLIDAPKMPFEKPPSWANKADGGKCLQECPATRPLILSESRNNTIGPDYVDPFIDEYFLDDLKEMGWTDKNSTPKRLPEQNCTRHYSLSDKTTLEIQEQTKRILQMNIKSAINGAPAPGIKYADYKLMQKARSIFDQVCPEDELPSPVLTGMLRMFRIVLNESFFHYPYDQIGDDSEAVKIWNILDKCAAESKPMTFVYEDPNAPVDDNGTAGNGTNSTESQNTTGPGGPEICIDAKDKRFVGVHYQFNGTLNRTILARLPCHLWTNITDLDLIIETAWKTVMFTHYYCARHFKDESVGFSVFEQKMERFFNRWIQHRWFYPGASYKGYSYVYQMYDLPTFALALDRCVSAARSFSVYRKWIQRPVYLKFLGGKLFEEQFDIPDKIAGRLKLDVINPIADQFNKKAYCLPYWHAPASNPGLNYNPDSDYKPGCVKYRKEEWVNPFMPSKKQGGGWKNTVGFL